MTITQLLTQIEQCTLCQEQLPLPAKPILQASQHSRILVAGQAPGQVTHDKGRPFDDKSGERLRDWLGVNPEQFYNPEIFAIVPMGFCYPGKGKSGDLPPIPKCAQTWREPLLAEMKNIELTILLGKYALDWHLARLTPSIGDRIASAKSLTEIVKRYELLFDHQVIALPHPSPRNNLWLKKNPWFEQEVLPLLKQRVLSAITN
ncbi:uracil-DNA glycosylase family protein [Thalassotalea euphylliae]|uniref:Uracil-DNA glycosylase family protein n=1 Tax=Thalassotalea euphylliae TaxID=1655234 RepID=A0A3E0U6L9_9GAMM|nr:uracil-DNA glycosylase family protein [Thalassotalea euphylliae]REL32430.1 uracil-DNA glycosylase family protein [Thalassotalea euphylliae]